MFHSPTVASVLTALVVAYTLGALPSAYVAARLRGVDVFKVGTGQAGATNVWRQVSWRTGLAVFICDAVKGLVTIVVARWLGLTGEWVLLAALAAVLGHWNSVFTRFKGGDGVSTWAGLVFGVAPLIAIPPFVIAGIIRLRWGSTLSHPTLWGGIAGAALFVALSFVPAAGVGAAEVYGLIGLGVAILIHSMVYRRRHGAKIIDRAVPADENTGTIEPAPTVPTRE